jgi:hypothetical protein
MAVHATGNRLDLRQFRHSSIVREGVSRSGFSPLRKPDD